MATENKLFTISLPAGADLSALQYRAVKLNSSGNVVVIAAITDIIIGILQNKPASGEPAEIAPISAGGVSKLILGETLAIGVKVGPSTVGKAEADVVTNHTIGILLEGGDLDDVGSVLLGATTVKA